MPILPVPSSTPTPPLTRLRSSSPLSSLSFHVQPVSRPGATPRKWPTSLANTARHLGSCRCSHLVPELRSQHGPCVSPGLREHLANAGESKWVHQCRLGSPFLPKPSNTTRDGPQWRHFSRGVTTQVVVTVFCVFDALVPEGLIREAAPPRTGCSERALDRGAFCLQTPLQSPPPSPLSGCYSPARSHAGQVPVGWASPCGPEPSEACKLSNPKLRYPPCLVSLFPQEPQ